MPLPLDPYERAEQQDELWHPSAMGLTCLWSADACQAAEHGDILSFPSQIVGGPDATPTSTNYATLERRDGIWVGRFSGASTDAYDCADTLGAVSEYTVMALVHRTASGSMACLGTSSSSGYGNITLVSNEGEYNYSGDGWGPRIQGGADSAMSADDWSMLLLTRSGSILEAWRDDDGNDSRDQANTKDTDAHAIGRGYGTTWEFTGDIAAIAMWSRHALGRHERSLLFGWMAWRYGRHGVRLMDYLPADHPFRNRPPLKGD